jgi:hypothetical protein
MKPTETIIYPDDFIINNCEIDKEFNMGNFYHAYNHCMSASQAIPRIKGILHFRLKMEHNEIVDVY